MKEKTVAILATLDTKAPEAGFMKAEIESLGGRALIIDIGVVGSASIKADYPRADVAQRGGKSLDDLLVNPTRTEAQPIMTSGAIQLLEELIAAGEIHAALALGGTQGTSMNGVIFQALPYGFPKVLLSTAASGDTSHFVGNKDITMMYSVSDILGLNVFSEKILANAAACAYGMAQVERDVKKSKAKAVIGITNLGVLTEGTMYAIELLEKAGYECITFHAIGAGGDAMEQMMRDGIIHAVLDYAMGDIADGVFGVLRSASDSRLTTAGKLGLPQVLIPGGTEHLGVLTDADVIPAEFAGQQHTWHSPVIFVPRVNAEQSAKIAADISQRLSHTTGKAKFLMPLQGVSRYSSADRGEIPNPELDQLYWEQLQAVLPSTVEREALDYNAEDPAFVEYAVQSLISLIEQ